jgi:hypothetical protein
MVLRVIKNIIFWSYGRTTWQYDVLCVLILCFVFLTPKSWFAGSELAAGSRHQNGVVAADRLLVSPREVGPNPGPQDLERGVRKITGRPNLKVKGWRALKDEQGRVAAYEVEIE